MPPGSRFQTPKTKRSDTHYRNNNFSRSENKPDKKGTAEMSTMDGTLRLSDTYYAPGLDFGLVSVPQLVQRGVCVHLSNEQAYIQKGSVRINLQRAGDLWALPMKQNSKTVTEQKKRTNAETWHISDAKMRQLIKDKLVLKTEHFCCPSIG